MTYELTDPNDPAVLVTLMKDSMDSSDTVTSLADNCSTPLALSLAVMTIEAMLSDPTRGEFSTVKNRMLWKNGDRLFMNILCSY